MVVLKEAVPQSVLLVKYMYLLVQAGQSKNTLFQESANACTYIHTILNFENMIHFIIQ